MVVDTGREYGKPGPVARCGFGPGSGRACEDWTVRILHLVGRSHHRGAERFAQDLAVELDRVGHSNRLLAIGPGHEGGTESDIETLTSAVRQHPGVLLRAALGIRRDLRDRPADVVLAHGGSAVQAAVLAAIGSGPPVVYQLILSMPSAERGRVWHWWWSQVLARTSAAVALTRPLATEIQDLGLRSPVRIIPNARRAETFEHLDRAECAAKLRAELGLAPDTPLVGFVGHFVGQKRPDVAVDVISQLGGIPDAHLVMVGSGPLLPAVEAQVAAAGLVGRVSFLGHRQDVEALLCGLDVLILTSDDEGMPGVAIEAQMAGCPVVSFPVGGVDEVLDPGISGEVLADHSVDAMARSVAELLASPGRLREMSTAARHHSRRFAMDVVVTEYESLLGEVLGGEKGS